MKNIAKYLKYYKLQVILGPIFKLIEAILELSCPILVARIIDIGISSGDAGYIIKYGLIVIALNIIGFAFAIGCQKCASIAKFDAHFLLFYNNFPKRFIISVLCSSSEWAYRLRVTVAFLCPNSSDSVLTSIPHSNALVAKVWRRE